MYSAINQMAPLLTVLALAGYCCWSESNDPPVVAAKESAGKTEVTSALLSPGSTPAPARNPFPSPAKKKTGAAAPPAAKEQLVKTVFVMDTSHLVLRAIFIQGDRRLAMINSKFYGEGDTLATTAQESDSEIRRNKSKPANPVKTAGPAYLVASVFDDHVVLQFESQTTELRFLHADKNSKSGSSGPRNPGK